MLSPSNRIKQSSCSGLNKNNNNTSRFEQQIDKNEVIETGFADPNELNMADFGRFLFGIGDKTDVLNTEDIRKISSSATIISDWPRWSQFTCPSERAGSVTTLLSITQTNPVRISKVQDREDQNHGKSSKRIVVENRGAHEHRDKQAATKLLWCCSDPPQQLQQAQATLKSRSRQKIEHFARSCQHDWHTELLIYAQLGYWAPEIVPKNFLVDQFMLHGNQRSQSFVRAHSASGGISSHGNSGRKQIYKFTNTTEIYNCVQEGRASVEELNMLINTCNFGTTTGIKRSTVFREENKQTPKKRSLRITMRTSDNNLLCQKWSIKVPVQNKKFSAFSAKSVINTVVIAKLNATFGVSQYQSTLETSDKVRPLGEQVSTSTSQVIRTRGSLDYHEEKPLQPSQLKLPLDMQFKDRQSPFTLGTLWHIDSQPLPSTSTSTSTPTSKSGLHEEYENAAVLDVAEEPATVNKCSFPSDLPGADGLSTSRSTTSGALQESVSENEQQKTLFGPTGTSAFTWSMNLSQVDGKHSERRRMPRMSLLRMASPMLKGKMIVPDLRSRLSVPDLVREVFGKIKGGPQPKQQRKQPLLEENTESFGMDEAELTDKIVEKIKKKQPAVSRILRAQSKAITADMRKALNLSAGADIPDLTSQKPDDDASKRFFLPTVVPIQTPNLKRLRRRDTDSRMIYPSSSFASSLSDSLAEMPVLNSYSVPKVSRRDTVQISYRKTISLKDREEINVSNQRTRSGRTQLRSSEMFDIETHVFMLPRLPPKPKTILDAIAGELHSTSPFVLDHFRQVCSQVVPEYTWIGEVDGDKIGIGLERLAADLLLYRNSSGHSIRYKLMSVFTAGELNYILRRQLRLTVNQPGQWLDQLLRSLVSNHSTVRTEAAIAVAVLVSHRRVMSQFLNEDQAVAISGIIHSLFVAGEYYPSSWPDFYVALGYLLQFNQHELVCETLIDRGQYAGFGGSSTCWPRLLAYVYTYWKPKVLRRIDISEKRLSLLLDAAFINPISRVAARECFAALSEYYTLRSHLFSYWTWKAQQTVSDETVLM